MIQELFGKVIRRHFLFSTSNGVREGVLYLEATSSLSIDESFHCLCEAQMDEAEKLGWDSKDLIFSRFYLSDMLNQKQSLYQSKAYQIAKSGAISIVEQRIIAGGQASWFLYYISLPKSELKHHKTRISSAADPCQNITRIDLKNYQLLWTCGFAGNCGPDSYKQTAELFYSLKSELDKNNMSLLSNTIRTWIYVRDIDNNYAGMVRARSEFFEQNGLTKSTRYIASTGIEAKLEFSSNLVSLDSFSVNGLIPSQIIRMEAPNFLNPPREYGVTFERGIKITFGDRSHLHISGTASIDNNGKVVHSGDPKNQTIRTLQNIEALLQPHGATLKDMGYFIVYLRNPNDQYEVLEILNQKIPEGRPMIFVQGSVCRPEWLIEIEGWAWLANETPNVAPFI